ncbi:hypothetical protein MKZ38_002502 [Zalerion maritima]|uniref:Uncharacterized protein n=1 Tax=Zalerion maritima TaxID=339359 RepID=A0AAD5WSE8_9PEZI|nr:hypothetical protein MKZ38_002502 [Zalerion maritima]
MNIHTQSQSEAHAARMDHTIKDLRRMVKEHQDAFSSLHAASTQNGQLQQKTDRAGAAQARSLAVSKATFEHLSQSKPVLPLPESTLPALLALRKTHQTIEESKDVIASQETSIEEARKRLEQEKANLADQHALTQALEKRIQMLREELERKQRASGDGLVKEQLEGLKKKKEHYAKEIRQIMRILKKFVDEQLGGMLAAEDLGGPVVGDVMEIDTDNLVAGFSAQGRPKKTKASMDEDKRQRKIDHMWPVQEGTPEKAQMKERDEASAAGAEIRQLIEELLNRTFEADGVGTEAYVRISRESSAVRFLVRSKVAQFHPKDATRLRLVGFGRELDD